MPFPFNGIQRITQENPLYETSVFPQQHAASKNRVSSLNREALAIAPKAGLSGGKNVLQLRAV